MPKSRNGKIATGFAATAFLFVFIAFVTPSWLVSDGYLPHPKLEQIGKQGKGVTDDRPPWFCIKILMGGY